jgi:L,D-transpeptidase YcbB
MLSWIRSNLFFGLLLILAVGPATDAGASAFKPMNHRARAVNAKTKSALQTIVRNGRLPDLRWPNFRDFRDPVAELYRRSNFTPIWIRDGHPTSQAQQVIALLQRSYNDGLVADDYDASRWTQRLARLQTAHTPSDEARFDVALTVCAMRYVSALWVGRINPQYFKLPLDVSIKKLSLPQFVRTRLAEGTDLQSAIAALEPPLDAYQRLRAALPKYIQLANADDGEKLPVPQGGITFEGASYQGVPRLVRLLRLLGDLPETAVIPDNSQMYEGALVEAVKRFQMRHGIVANGFLNPETLDQLNVPLSRRVEQMRMALERYRWLRYQFPRPPIIINIPEFRLYALDGQGNAALTMTIDVGQDFDGTRTPVLESNIRSIVFRPYWEVPFDIQQDEIVSNIQDDPEYLSKNHFEAVASNGKTVPVAEVGQHVLDEIRRGQLRIRQKPGSDNSLGLVKFVFPNRYNVYLHDVPTWGNYFSDPIRDVTHGCIHVQKADNLAAWLLRDKQGWTIEKVKYAMTHGPDNASVDLKQPLPIVILYATAAVHENGDVYFYPDLYGYDAELHEVLKKGYPYP